MRAIAFCSIMELCRGSLVDWDDALIPIRYEPALPPDQIYLCRLMPYRLEIKRLD